MHNSTILPVCSQPFLSLHLCYQMNYCLPNWMTSPLSLHFPTIPLHPLPGHTTGWLQILQFTYPHYFSVTLGISCECCFVIIIMPCPTSHTRKGLNFEWLHSWTESATIACLHDIACSCCSCFLVVLSQTIKPLSSHLHHLGGTSHELFSHQKGFCSGFFPLIHVEPTWI